MDLPSFGVAATTAGVMANRAARVDELLNELYFVCNMTRVSLLSQGRQAAYNQGA